MAIAAAPPPIPAEALRWHRCQRVRGHGVASGTAPGSPYPAGTIALQIPHFARLGLDLSSCHPGTLNLRVPGGRWLLRQPAWHVERLAWTTLHPPETFSFWPCLLRWRQPSSCPAVTCHQPAAPVAGWIYRPDPATKERHHQPDDQLEVLAPWIEAVGHDAALELELELGVDGRHCRLIEPVRLRSRLLEFLKFRVLAAQEGFFAGFDGAEGATALRRWLGSQGCAELLDLEDAELLGVLHTARQLYT
ncbi:hypothetical protein [Cyanobium sp. CH-040]|uniref:hypothetical protein n=1 Tax=Cyanobium sp. CH-040 TaxID=2823708 RepID=UPI0020CCA882|nr:hypothetical protein [Cyanobium sp. CH-040]MCP9927588.1 hypothetical protein [Cyanobium sp. CH-040]